MMSDMLPIRLIHVILKSITTVNSQQTIKVRKRASERRIKSKIYGELMRKSTI
jgi:hypothetical protein